MIKSSRLSAAVILACTSAPVAATEDKSWLSLFSPDRLLTYVVQSGIIAARGVADITYSGLSVDAFGGRATLYDLEVEPIYNVTYLEDCRFTAQQITLRTGPLKEPDMLRLRVEVSGFKMSSGCLGREQQMGLRMAGLSSIDIPHFRHDWSYQMSTGAATYSGSADVTGLAAVTVDAEFPYFSLEAMDFDYGEPLFYLSNLKITAEDRGAWNRFSYFIPPEFRDPKTSRQSIESFLDTIKRDFALMEGDPVDWQPAYDAFAFSVLGAAPLFLASPDRLVLQTNVTEEGGVNLVGFDDDGPRQVFAWLQPTVSLTTVEENSFIDLKTLRAVLMGDDVSDDDLRRVGLALLTGEGAPMNVSRGVALLVASKSAVDGDVAAKLAQSLKYSDPHTAYFYALQASSDYAYGATSLLDQLEPQLTFEEVEELQGRVAKPENPKDISLSLVRDLAQMYLDGRGKSRSYSLALYWALIGSAAGDASSKSIAREVDARMERIAGAKEWANLRSLTEDQVLQNWIGQGIADQLSP